MTNGMANAWQNDGNEEFSHRFDNGSTLTDGRTDLRTTTKTERARLVPNAPTPVDNEVQVSREDMLRTRVVLAQLAGEQERLSAALNTTGLTDFADRADWLIAHRTTDEQRAWRRHWRRLGVSDPEPRRERFQRSSLAVVRKRRRKPALDDFTARMMQVGLRVLEAREAK